MIALARRLTDHTLRSHFQIPLVREADGWHTALILLGDAAAACTFHVRLRDGTGRLVARSAERPLPPLAYVRVECGDLLAGVAHAGRFEGNATVLVRDYVGAVIYMEYANGARRTSTHSLYAGGFRHPVVEWMKQATPIAAKRRRATCLHVPVVGLGPDDDYEIALHNLAEANRHHLAQPAVILTRADGATREARLRVAPGGTTCRSLRQLFDGVPEFLGGADGLLSVVDDASFLHGVYFRSGRSFACDHLHFLG